MNMQYVAPEKPLTLDPKVRQEIDKTLAEVERVMAKYREPVESVSTTDIIEQITPKAA